MIGLYFSHVLTLCLCVLAILCCLSNVVKIKQLPSSLRRMLLLYVVTTITTLLVFLGIRVEGLIDGVEGTSSWNLLFDYLVMIAIISGMVSLNVGTSLFKDVIGRGKCTKEKCFFNDILGL